MITFDMASGEKVVVLSEPTVQSRSVEKPQETVALYAQPRLMTVEEAIELERRSRR
ncbi:MAG: hypothetical protein JO218_04130 [Burkholderiales bacterium]|jgi:hypothetical protein|nr:hypothetical protein [Burkholderiales bacterium]